MSIFDDYKKRMRPEAPPPVLHKPPEPIVIDEGNGITRDDIIALIDRKLKTYPLGMVYSIMKIELTSEAQRYKSLVKGQSTRDDIPTLWRKQKEREIIIDVIKKNYGNVISEFKTKVKKIKEVSEK